MSRKAQANDHKSRTEWDLTRAHDSERRAQKAKTPRFKKLWHEVAKHWREMAEQANNI